MAQEEDFYNYVDPKFISDLHEDFSCLDINRLKDNGDVKIIRIKDCTNLNALMHRMKKKTIKKAFSKTSHLFVLIIKTNGIIHDNLKLHGSIFNDQRPFILQIVDSAKKSNIYYMEYKSSKFKQFSDSSAHTSSDLVEPFSTKSGCKLTTLLRGLNSGLLGNIEGDLSNAKLVKGDLILKLLWSAAKFNVLCLRFLKLFNIQLDMRHFEDSGTFKDDSKTTQQSLKALLDLPFEFPKEKRAFQKILMFVIKGNCSEFLQKFDYINRELMITAYNLKYFDCITELIEADSSFPIEFVFETPSPGDPASVKLKKALDERLSFHEAIKAGNVESLKAFIDKKPRLKYAYDQSNKSAVTVAVESNKLEIYTLLLSRGFSAGIDTNFETIMKKLDEEKNRSIRSCLRQHFKGLDLSHLLYLISLSMFKCCQGKEEEKFIEALLRMYIKLSNIPEVQPILQLLENCDKLKIVFDLDKSHVKDMDPLATEETMGMTYLRDGYIYIAAKNYDKEETFLEIAGTLAHELTHYAVNVVYKNDCKPYQATNDKREEKFERITQNLKQHCEKNLETTSCIINWVFELYPKEHWHAELIVRVAQLFVLTKEDDLSEMKQEYCGELFEFFSTVTLKDITHKIDLLKQQAETLDINETIDLIEDVKNFEFRIKEDQEKFPIDADKNNLQFISSNIPMLTLSMIYHSSFKKYGCDVDKEIIIMDMEKLKDKSLSDKIENVCKTIANPLLIVMTKNTNLVELFRDVGPFMARGRLVIVADGGNNLNDKETVETGNFKYTKFTHTWNDLDIESQRRILEQTVEFHGRSIALEEILSSDSDAFNVIPLQELMSNKIEIENIQQNESFSLLTGAYVDRKFNVPIVKTREEKITEEIGETSSINNVSKEEAKIEDEQSVTRNMKSKQTVTIPLSGGERDEEKMVKIQMTQDELLQEMADKKIVIISDSAGMGKSTTLIEIAKNLETKHQSHWISIVDLKQHTRELTEIENSSELDQSLFEFLLKLISKDFDQRIFSSHYKAGKVIAILDGFDEICPNFKEIMIKIIKTSTVEMGNQLWITTRSHLKHELEQELNQIACSLVPLSQDDQIEVIMQYWKSKESTKDYSHMQKIARDLIEMLGYETRSSDATLSVGMPTLNSDRTTSHLFSNTSPKPWGHSDLDEMNYDLKENLSTSLISSQSELMGIPLQVRMIAEIYENNIEDAKSLNLFSIYDKFTDKMMENSTHNKGEISSQDMSKLSKRTDSTWKIHQKMALDHIFGLDFANFQCDREGITNEMIARVGIVHLDSAGKIHFIHETFAEFLVAELIISNLKCNKPYKEVQEMIANMFYIVLTNQKHQIIRLFLNKSLAENHKEMTNTWFSDFLEKMLETKLLEANNLGLMNYTVEEQHEKLFEFCSAIVNSFKDEKLKTGIMRSKTQFSENMLMLACRKKEKTMLKTVCEKIQNQFSNEELQELMTEKSRSGLNPLHFLIIKNNEKALPEILSIMTEVFILKDKLKSYLKEKEDKHKRNILSLMAEKSSAEFFNSLWKFLQEIFDSNERKNLLLEVDVDQCNCLHLASKFNNKHVVNSFFEIIQDELDPEEQKKIILTPDKSYHNILHCATLNTQNQQIMITIFDRLKNLMMEDKFKSMLQQSNSHKSNVLHSLIIKNNEQALSSFLSILEKVFTEDQLKNYLKKKEDKYGLNIMCLMAIKSSLEFLNSFWEFLRNKLDLNERKNLLLKVDSNNYHCLHLVSQFSNKDVVEALFKIIQDELDPEERRNFILEQNKWNHNILHCAILNTQNEGILTTINNCIKSLLMEDDFKSVLELLHFKIG